MREEEIMSLKKEINLPRGVALAVGMVIGSGMLGLPGIVVQSVGARSAMFSWILVVVAMLPMVYIFGRLGRRYTTAAGLTRYAEVEVGREWASDSASILLWGTYCIGIPALAWIGGAYVCELVGLSQRPWALVSTGVILVVSTVVNLLGARITSLVNTVSLWMIGALIVVIVASHPDLLGAGVTALFDAPGEGVGLRSLVVGSGLIVWAFLGWENMSFSAEEFEDPERNIPRVYWLSFALVAFMYLALAFTVNGAQVRGTSISGASGLVALLPGGLGAGLLVFIIVAIVANANSWVLGASRLTYSAGRSGLLPNWFARTTRTGTPDRALVCMLVVYGIVILLAWLFDSRVDALVGIVSQDFIVLYVVSIIAFLRSEGRSALNIGICVASLAVCAILLTGFDWWVLYPAVLIALGAAIHARRTRRASLRQPTVNEKEQ